MSGEYQSKWTGAEIDEGIQKAMDAPSKADLNKKANDYTIEIYNGTGGNPKPVRFASFNYSTCNSENGIAAKIGMVSGHGNGSSYAFLQDAIIKVTYTGAVSVDNFKYYGSDTGTYDGVNRQYGDIFWLIDTTNKIVDFYCLMGQYARVYQTPWKRLTYSSGGTVTQHTSCTVYSSGTKAWANNSEIALKSDITSGGGSSGDHTHDEYLPKTGGTITGDLGVGGKIVQGNPSADTTVTSMNRLESDLFIEGNGSAPNNPRAAGFYLGKSATDANRHLDIVSGETYSYIDFNKANRETDYDVRLLVNVDNGDTQFVWGNDGALNQKKFNVVGGILMQNGVAVALQNQIPSKTSQLTNDSGFKTTDNNTTYSLSKSGSTITLTGSDGSATSVTDANDNTTYNAAGSSLGLVKSGGDVTISSGVITVNDDSHNHVISNIDGLQSALDDKANSSHTHDDRYYTETEVNNLLNGKANSSHSHGYIQDGTVGIKSSDSNEISFASNQNVLYFGYDNRLGSTGLVDTYKFGKHSGSANASNGTIECGKVVEGGTELSSKYAPLYSYGTSDLTAGSSELTTGKVHLVYE